MWVFVSVMPARQLNYLHTVHRALEAPCSAARSIVTAIHTRGYTLPVGTLATVEDGSIASLSTMDGPHRAVDVGVATIGVTWVRKTVGAN